MKKRKQLALTCPNCGEIFFQDVKETQLVIRTICLLCDQGFTSNIRPEMFTDDYLTKEYKRKVEND